MQMNIDEEFLKVSSKGVQTAKRRFSDAERHLEESLPQNNINSEFEPQELLNAAGENFAFASELGLKSNIIYDDFRKSNYFNQTIEKIILLGDKEVSLPIVGSDEWYKALAGNVKQIDFISNPKQIRSKIILENDPSDERVTIETDPRYNSQFLTLSFDGSKINGHSLYSYFQLQSSIAKSLINTEYYCYVEDEVKYTIYALLTEDILTNNNDGKTVIPIDFMEKLDSVKNAAVDLRYASISFDNVKESELKFLKDFSSSIINVGDYRFPIPKKYNQLDFEKYKYDKFICKGFILFDNLDKMSKYYLQSCFSDKEIVAFKEYIDILIKTGISNNDLNVFINNCIYFKNHIKNIMKINLEFTIKQFVRIDNFCRLIKAFQPFDSDSKRLCDNDAFCSEEKKLYYIEKIKGLKENNNNQIKLSLDKKVKIFIGMLNKGNKDILRIKNNETLEGYPEIKLSYFWIKNKDIIKQKLFVELKDDLNYETARRIIDEFETTLNIDKKITIFIDMLNKGNKDILRIGNKETLEGYPEIKLSNFWKINRNLILNRLFVDLEKYIHMLTHV